MLRFIKVGIVDDHRIYKTGLKLALSHFDDVIILFDAENGVDLLSRLDLHMPNVILLDLRMPEMDGISVLQQVKQEYPELKVIILSIYDDAETIDRTRHLGADSFLSKSSDVVRMYEEIRKVVS